MLLARMAEAVYWAGRYLERAEGTARIVQVHTDAHVDMPVGEDVGWEPLLAIVGVDSEFAERYQAADRRRRRGGGRSTTSSSSSSTARRIPRRSWPPSPSARENLRTARPVVPREAWEACNNLWLASSDNLAEAATREGRVLWLRRVIAGCQRINGILLGTMSRDEAMSFLTIGQNLERADLTTRVLDVRSESLRPNRGDSYDVVHWMAVLRSLAAYQPFRRAMPARPQGGSTLRFLLQDDRFPRAVSACLTEARAQLKGLARSEDALDACCHASLIVASAAVSPPHPRRSERVPRRGAGGPGRHPPNGGRDLLPADLRRLAAGVRGVLALHASRSARRSPRDHTPIFPDAPAGDSVTGDPVRRTR